MIPSYDAAMAHTYRPTINLCPCGEFLSQIVGTNMLACLECGETRWLIPEF